MNAYSRRGSRECMCRAAQLLAVSVIAAIPAISHTQPVMRDYPSHTVRLIVPNAVGGPTDISTRVVAQKLTQFHGQQFIVENRPGAAGIIGTELVARAPPDGYTLLCVALPHVVNQELYKKLPYDTLKDFQPVAQFISYTNVLVVHPSLPAKSVKELIALAKAAPSRLTYGASGFGTSLHLSAELFKTMAGVSIVYVPYKGTAAAMTDLRAGEISMMFDAMVAVMPHVKFGRVRALGVTSANRWALLPELPTIAEAGLPGYEVNSFVGMLAPARTASSIIEKLNSSIFKALQLSDLRDQLAALGAILVAVTPVQFGTYLQSEMQKWSRVLHAAGVKADFQ